MTLIPEVHRALRDEISRNSARRRRSRALPALGLFAGLAITTSAVAAVAGWSPVLGSNETGHPSVSSIPTNRDFADQLAVLREPQSASDQGIDSQNALRLLSSAGLDGVHLADIRILGTHEGGAALLVPVDRTGPGVAVHPELSASDQLCIIYARENGAAAQNCGDPTALANEGVGGWIPASHQQGDTTVITGLSASHHYGIVPDGVATVRIRLEDQTVLRAAVSNNFFDATTTSNAAPVSAEWLDSNDQVVHRVG